MIELIKLCIYSFLLGLFIFTLIGFTSGCVSPIYPWCSARASGEARCHSPAPEWRLRRGARGLDNWLVRYACAVKEIKDRNYLICPNTEDAPPHYLLIECESWREYCLPLEE